ncbi:hypothetical protein Pse7367_1491 [Thalassoporum mexicanum PCC 7367]|uniref:hypothetical protein n=1 Tax=Thalassoporum mexicanum TaxID=3457544 RepID=UPI00029FD882|nr:hypothetical protein [Pseudanabaena sp. PCC 7367]AFY69781.1 hypothetical protein Pse7367_1491 [Pseudanabaena sp. PCC 7367]
MSYATQGLEYASGIEAQSVKIDPLVIRAAKQIYRFYVDSYASQLPRPLGVAVNRIDMSGKLVYSQLILLPQESFVPIEQIESDFH